MDLKMFLDPVAAHVYDDSLPQSALQHAIFINKDIMYDLDGIDLVILGLEEYRGHIGGFGTSDAANEIRKKLYPLSKTSGKNRILDLGNLRNGPTVEDSCARLQAVMQFLLERDICVILIGGTHDLDFGQYLGYQELNKLVTFLTIDANFDLNDGKLSALSHTAQIIKHNPNYLFNYIHLAHQTYFVDQAQLNIMDKLFFEAHRLGEIKNNIHEMEPVIRDADIISFDISAIQSIYCPGAVQPNIFGLSGEEACQLAWFSGQSDKLSSIGFYNYDVSADDANKSTASVIATMIWYFCEGFYQRKGDKNFMTDDYIVYEVHMNGNPESIRFYKSKKSEKWWMEIPNEKNNSVFMRNAMVPCSYQDYTQAQKGEIPQRWYNAIARFD